MKKAVILGLMFCLCVTAGFGQDKSIAELEKEIAELKSVITELEREIISLETRISTLERTYEYVLNNLPKRNMAPLPPLDSSIQPAPTEEGPWMDKQNWRRLQKGMTREAVKRILGDPERINRYSTWESWDYPGGGDVNFNDSGRVTSWSEPYVFGQPETESESSVLGLRKLDSSLTQSDDAGSQKEGKEGIVILWDDPSQGREPTFTPRPQIPSWVSEQGLRLQVVVSFELTPLGVLRGVRVEQGSGYSDVDSAVLEALRRWKFRPVSSTRTVTGRVPYTLIPR